MEAFADDLMPVDELEMTVLRHPDGKADSGRVAPDLHDAVRHLLRRRAELRGQLGEMEPEELWRVRWSNHLVEDAQEHQDRHQLAAIRIVLRSELLQIEHALERAARGLYGICEDCGQQIPTRRMYIVPATTVCVACQQRREARDGRQ